MKTTANVITFSRILFAIAFLFAPPFSAGFWICYLCAGLSDVLDGMAARKLKQESDLGARLDSIADFVFACAIATVSVIYVPIPMWLWVCAGLIALLRLAGYAIGYLKYHRFSALHTYANKLAGALLFALPLLYRLLGISACGILLCAVTAFSAAEEVLITIRSKRLERNCKGIFIAGAGKGAADP